MKRYNYNVAVSALRVPGQAGEHLRVRQEVLPPPHYPPGGEHCQQRAGVQGRNGHHHNCKQICFFINPRWFITT